MPLCQTDQRTTSKFTHSFFVASKLGSRRPFRMADLDQLRHQENLRRAWRWIRSNPDAAFKSYFRPLYQRFAIAEDALLADLADRLARGVYDPEPPCKIFHPKASGILRPYSLLTVEDQIVYQAATNLIAEKLYPSVVQRYFKQVFGHLYAGKNSAWFYRKWSDGYRAFNDAARDAFANGYVFAASFDLTACYDSLDHGVLCHFIGKLGFDLEFCQKLSGWLEKWTPTEKGIFHNHGIPQGPLSSGLLSEVVLSHFDELKLKGVDFCYFRYVDDIRLFAHSEHDLRRLLVSLDLMSKDVGLFPQSGKIEIHRIENIDRELKSISTPPESAIGRGFVDQAKLYRRIVALTPGYRIADATRFKYLLAHASPEAKLTIRLWKILTKQPETYRSICNYLRRYPRLPRIPAQKLIDVIKASTLYQSVRAEFVGAADSRLPQLEEAKLARYLRTIWTPRSMHSDLQVAVGRFLIRTGNLNGNQIAYACRAAPSWWTRASLIDAADPTALGSSVLQSIVATGVLDHGKDASLAASWKAFESSQVPSGARRHWNKAAELLLREVGMIQRSTAVFCGIAHSFGKLDRRIPSARWRALFGERYFHAELQAVETVAASGVNITGFVNYLDVFNDWLLDAVYRADGTIGNYTLGHIGSALQPTSRLAIKFPATFSLATEVHDRRYQSMASHPLSRRSGRPTKKISYRFLATAKRLLIDATRELIGAGYL
jgi:hypothetical protein